MTTPSLPALAVALLAFSVPALGQTTGCPAFFPGGRPPALLNPKLAARTTLLCNDAYASLASGVTRGALWSAEHLTAASVGAAHDLPRLGEFHPDERLPQADRGELEDYQRSGYDRGHMAPSGDMPDDRAQQQSFSLANMVPQSPELNRKTWARIEERVRRLAETRGELYVVTGPAFTAAQVSSVGPDGVLVPSAIWKAVYDPAARGTGVYACSNTDKPVCQVVPVATLVRITGVDPFPSLPAGLKATAITLPTPGAGGRSAAARERRAREPSLLDRLFGR